MTYDPPISVDQPLRYTSVALSNVVEGLVAALRQRGGGAPEPIFFTGHSRHRLVSQGHAMSTPGPGGTDGKSLMSKIQLPAIKPKRRPWNLGRLAGQKRPLLPKQVRAIRARLELAGNLCDLALFNLTIDSKLRGCDLVGPRVAELVVGDRVRERVPVIQSKTRRPVQFEVTKNTRALISAWVNRPAMIGCAFLFPSRFHARAAGNASGCGARARSLNARRSRACAG